MRCMTESYVCSPLVADKWVMSHMDEACRIWMCHAKYECFMSHVIESYHTRMSHVTYERVMSHVNESHHLWRASSPLLGLVYEWVVSHMNESCHIRMSHNESPFCRTWTEMCTRQAAHDSFKCVTRLIHMCDRTHSYVWQDSCICVTGCIHMCDRTHSYVWQNSFTCVPRLIHMCDKTLSCVNRTLSCDMC